MNTQIKFRADFPDDLRSEIEEYVQEWRWIIPRWCHQIVLEYDSDLDGDAGNNTPHEYRSARISFGSNWLILDSEERERTLVHELLHISIAPMWAVFRNTVKHLEEETARSIATEDWRLAMEGAVEDIEHLLFCKKRR